MAENAKNAKSAENAENAKAAQDERKKLVARAGVVGAGTLLSRVLGLCRDMAFAALFPVQQTDAFFVAFTIPNALRQLLGEGAVSSAVVPVLSGKLAKEGESEARAFFASVRGVSLAALLVTTVLGMVFARELTDLFAGGYRARPLDFERTVQFTRIVFPYIFFMGSAALGMAALNAKRRFAVAAFAPGLLNVAFLLAAFLLPGPLGRAGIDPSHAMVFGALLGGFLQVAAQWPALRAIGYAGRPTFRLSDPGVREVLRRMGPMTLGIGVYYIDLVLSRRFLSELGPGAQSYFAWAMRLCDFPQGIFVMALSTAALPSLSTFAARGELGELGKTYAQGMRLSLFVAIPASAGLVFLGEPIVTALLQRGEFNAVSARETARALAWQGGAIWTVAAVRQLVPVFYALGNTRTPVIISAIDLLAFIALAVGLRGSLGHAGISAAVAGSSAVQMLLLFAALKFQLPHVHAAEIAGSALRTLAASLVGAGAGWMTAQHAGALVEGWPLRLVWPGVFAVAAFCVAFVVAARLFRSPELESLLLGLRRRLRRGKAPR